eukprot:2782705-Rhodomonas_salina.1
MSAISTGRGGRGTEKGCTAVLFSHLSVLGLARAAVLRVSFGTEVRYGAIRCAVAVSVSDGTLCVVQLRPDRYRVAPYPS